jgi:hypothetical protein
MKRHIWVVEMDWEDASKWNPTVGVGLTREDVRIEKKKWGKNNPGSKFRIRKYVPEDEIGNYILPSRIKK